MLLFSSDWELQYFQRQNPEFPLLCGIARLTEDRSGTTPWLRDVGCQP